MPKCRTSTQGVLPAGIVAPAGGEGTLSERGNPAGSGRVMVPSLLLRGGVSPIGKAACDCYFADCPQFSVTIGFGDRD